MNNIEFDKFNKIRQEAEDFYKTIGNIYCPYFKEKIAFNAKGIEHIKFQRIRKARSHQDQYIRLKLISLAPRIVKDSHTLQGTSQRKSFERIKTNNRWEIIMRSATYYEFVAVINNYRVRVIIKEVEGSQGKYFWSIIPFWKMDKITCQRVMYSGKPEID